MGNLIKTEWLKIRNYPAFWWMAGIVALSYPGVNYIFYQIYREFVQKADANTSTMMKFLIGNPFTFPEVWHTVAYASSIFIFIPSILVIMFITNEYTFKTHRQNIIDGWSRNQFMTAKFVDVLLISLITTLIYILVSIMIGYLNINESDGNMWGKTEYILYFFMQTFSQLSVAFLITFITRKAFIALGIFLFYKIILEKLLVGLASVYVDDIGRFLPFEISNRIIPVPAFVGRFGEERYNSILAEVNEHIVYTIIFTALTWLLCFRLNKKRDL